MLVEGGHMLDARAEHDENGLGQPIASERYCSEVSPL